MWKSLVALPLLLVSSMAMTAQPNEITLSCGGRIERIDSRKIEHYTEEVKDFGLVVNLTNRTVIGFYPANPLVKETPLVVRMTAIDESLVSFEGNDPDSAINFRHIDGNIDRVSGTLRVFSSIHYHLKNTDYYTSEVWNLSCVPRRRVF
jgi:hypothetical protein